MATFRAEIKFEFDGAMEVDVPDLHTARLAFASFQGAVVSEIQTWPTIDLNRADVSAQVISIGAV